MFDPVLSSVLHQVRLLGVADRCALTRRLGVDDSRIEALLAAASNDGFVVRRTGRLTGWSLTSEGRTEGERALADELALAGTRQEIESEYEKFLELNARLLSVCTDWQTTRMNGFDVVNDHSDRDRDASVLHRLSILHSDAMPMLKALSSALDRFLAYGNRLGAAHERIIEGETEWLTMSTIDSYHTVWFELHEDLLATLGRRRSDEQGLKTDRSREEQQ